MTLTDAQAQVLRALLRDGAMLHNRRTGRYIINADSFSSYEVFPMIDRYIVRDTLGGFRVLPAGLSALAQHEAQA